MPLKQKLLGQKLILGSDHRGYMLKSSLKKWAHDQGCSILDVGVDEANKPVDYPDIASRLVKEMKQTPNACGVLICGSGIGISIAANRDPFIRAALCYNQELAQKARAHNDANVLVLGASFISENAATHMLHTFLTTLFEAGRHASRLEKLNKPLGSTP